MAPRSEARSPCRWAALFDESQQAEKALVELPPCEQWSRGKELLGLLQTDEGAEAPSAAVDVEPTGEDAADVGEAQAERDANAEPLVADAALTKTEELFRMMQAQNSPELKMTIRRTFVELVAPLRHATRARSQSDSAADGLHGRLAANAAAARAAELQDESSVEGDGASEAPEADVEGVAVIAGMSPALVAAGVSPVIAAVSPGLASIGEVDEETEASWTLPASAWGDAEHSASPEASAAAAAAAAAAFVPGAIAWPLAAQAGEMQGAEWMHAAYAAPGTWWFPMAGEEGDFQAYYDASAAEWAFGWPQRPAAATAGKNGKAADKASRQASAAAEKPREKTTVMLRNLPCEFTRAKLLELLEDEGFAGSFDFVYLPVDFSSRRGLGYAIVNFVSPSDASRCWAVLDGFSDWEVDCEKACGVSWGDPHQGLQAHVDRYRNSPVMHESVPEEWKPALFESGAQVPFPPATKTIKAPKMLTRAVANARGA